MTASPRSCAGANTPRAATTTGRPIRSWDYYPTYIAKLEAVRRGWSPASPAERVLDAGCGEGMLVEEFAGRLAIEGIDANYSSDRVRSGSVTALPYRRGHIRPRDVP